MKAWIVRNTHRNANRRDAVRVIAPDYSSAMNRAAEIRPRLKRFWFCAAKESA